MCFYLFMTGILLIFILNILLKKVNVKFIPYYFISGFLAFILINLSSSIINWDSIYLNQSISYFIAGFFAIAPHLSSKIDKKYLLSIRDFWGYSFLHIVIQWAIGCSIIILFNHLPQGFLTVLPSGFIGGHSTALALSEFYEKSNWANASSVFTLSATVGFLVAILGSFFITKKVSINLNCELNFAVKDIIKRKEIYLILLIILLATTTKKLLPFKQIPIFLFSFIFSHILKKFIKMNKDILHLLNEFLIAFIITASIAILDVKVLSLYKLELSILFSIGILSQSILYYFIAPKIIKSDLFEKRLLTWGWTTGVVAVSIALNQSYTTPSKRDEFFEKFALCYLLISPIELTFLLLIPILANALGTLLILGLLIILFFLILIIFSQLKRKS